MTTDPDIRDMVREIDTEGRHRCNAWESEFIDSMLEWKGEFTARQEAVIRKLYDKAIRSKGQPPNWRR